jgi:WD40 repeat protein
MTFNGFISYSHAADGRLAPAVQRGLHRLAKPWHRRRALWIFRDQTGLAVTPRLWSSIQTALDGSEYFVLLASPEAARSQWVNREIEHWIATKSADRILPVVTDGEWIWDPDHGDFTDASTAVPPALHGVFTEEPFFLDLRWARGSEHLSLQHSRFRDAIAQLAAPMHGVSTDELEGEDVRQHRRARRLQSGAVVTLVVLALLASLTGMSAVRNAERAKNERAEALRQQQVASGQRDIAEKSAEEARRQGELARQQQDRAAQAAAEAEKSERLAREQQQLADQAAAEARRQQKLADQATTRTQEQQQLAKAAAERAQRLQKEADRLAAIAAEQKRLAAAAAKEADRQQRIAASRRLLTQARATVVDDPKTALMLGAAADELNPDAVTRRQLAGVVTTTNYAGSIADVASAEYGPDGSVVTLGKDGRVALWNVATPARPVRLASFDSNTTGPSPEVSRDGRTLAIVDKNRKAVLYDIADRSRPVRLATLPTAVTVTAIEFSEDGNTFVTGEASGTATLWDTTDRKRPVRLATLEYSDYLGPGDVPSSVRGLAISPNGRLLIVDNGRIADDPATLIPERPVYDLTDRDNPVQVSIPDLSSWGSFAFSPDGSKLAVTVSGRIFSTVTIFDVEPEPLRRTALDELPPDQIPPYWQSPPPMLPDPEPDPDETGGIDIGERLNGLHGYANTVAFSPDGNLVAAGDQYGNAMVWDRTAMYGKSLYFTSVQARSPISEVSFGPDAETLLTTDTSGTAKLWSVAPHGAPESLHTFTGPGGDNLATVFSRDGRSLIAAGQDGTARRWNITNPRRPVRGADLALHSDQVRAVAFSPDLRTVAAVELQSGKVTVADATRPAVRTTLTTLPWSPGETMVFSPDGHTLAVVPDPHHVLLWDVADRARPTFLGKLTGGDFSWAMAFSPDGRTLVTGGNDSKINLWNLTDRSAPVRLGTLTGHSDVVTSLAFSPNGRYLISGSHDKTASLWDVTDRSRPHRLAVLEDKDWVKTVAFSPDGRTAALGVSDGALLLWDTIDPAAPLRLARVRGTLDEYGVHDLVFGRDGRTLAAVGTELRKPESITLWDYQKLNRLRADPAKSACATTGRGLTAAEWARLIPEVKYRRSCRD